MKPTHERLIIVGPRSLRVQGDFGRGHSKRFGPDPKDRQDAILQAIFDLPGARIIGLAAEELAVFEEIQEDLEVPPQPQARP